MPRFSCDRNILLKEPLIVLLENDARLYLENILGGPDGRRENHYWPPLG